MAQTSDDSEAWDEFYNELDHLQLCMPGSGGKGISFSHDQLLLDMVHKQYPHWRDEGKVTSVPIARIPKFFLNNLQLTKNLQEKFKSTQKGDGAEKNLYKLFVEENFAGQPGMIVFPNFNGSDLFKTQAARVEIDMILVLQSKGIFVFNVKNVGGSSISLEKIRNDVKKHSNLIRMLLCYQKPDRSQFIPIHNVVCNFSDQKSYRDLGNETGDNREKILVFNKTQLTPKTFKESWIESLEGAGIEAIPWSHNLEVLVARLITLSSMEGSLALIHEQIERSIVQTVKRQADLEDQLKVRQVDENFSKVVVNLSKTTSHKGKQKFILWTNEQIEIIARVYAQLRDPMSRGLRLLVAGCKGSGKTVLLAFLAQLAEIMDESRDMERKGNILVCDGSFSSPVLHKRLQQIFSSTGIAIFSSYMTPEDFSWNRSIGSEDFEKMCLEFTKQLSKASFLLCDEFVLANNSILLDSLREDQHCVLFTSLRESVKLGDNFEIFHLSASLRSTATITEFANRWRDFAYLRRYDFECKKANNFEGEKVDIRVFDNNKNEFSLEKSEFKDLCVEVVCEYVEKSRGLDTLPVVPLLDRNTYNLVIEKLKKEKHNVRECGADNQVVQHYPADEPSDLPVITFFKPGEIEGSEFGVVIILINIEHASEIPGTTKRRFFCAITRATSKLVIVVNKTQLSGCKMEVNRSGKCCSCLQTGADSKFERYMKSICSISSPKASILLIGRKPELPFKELDSRNCPFDIPNIDNISVYIGPQGGLLLYIEDLFREADLEILHKFGVRSIILMPAFGKCRYTYEFYNKSALCISTFCKKRQNMFLITGMIVTKRDSDLLSVANFCFQYLGMEITTDKLATESRDNELFDPNDPHFSWEKWAEKGHEVHRLGIRDRALEIYSLSLNLLEKLYKSKIAEGKLYSARDERTQIAEFHLFLADTYCNLATVGIEKQTLFSWPAAGSNSVGYYLNKSLQHAMQAIRWNVCHGKIYRKFQSVLTIITNFCEKQIEILETSAKEGEPISRKSDVSWKFKQKLSGDDIRQKLDWPVVCDMSVDSPEHQQKKLEFEESIERYKILVTSSKRRESDLLLQIKIIANLAASLSKESLQLTNGHPSESEVNFWKIKQMINEVGRILDNPVRQAFESWLWDPLEVCGYQALILAANKLQIAVSALQSSAVDIKEKLHLSECNLFDHIHLSIGKMKKR